MNTKSPYVSDAARLVMKGGDIAFTEGHSGTGLYIAPSHGAPTNYVHPQCIPDLLSELAHRARTADVEAGEHAAKAQRQGVARLEAEKLAEARGVETNDLQQVINDHRASLKRLGEELSTADTRMAAGNQLRDGLRADLERANQRIDTLEKAIVAERHALDVKTQEAAAHLEASDRLGKELDLTESARKYLEGRNRELESNQSLMVMILARAFAMLRRLGRGRLVSHYESHGVFIGRNAMGRLGQLVNPKRGAQS